MRLSLAAIRAFCRRLEAIERGRDAPKLDVTGAWVGDGDLHPPEARAGAIDALVAPLSVDARAELLALLRVGGGVAEAWAWDETVATARSEEATGEGLAAQLVRIPDSDALLEDGLDLLGLKPGGRWP